MQTSRAINSSNLINNNRITAPCYVLCTLIMLVVGLLPLLPHSFTQVLRPVFIAVCLASGSSYYYPMERAPKAQLALLAYLGVILLCFSITKSALIDYTSMLLFGLFFVLVAQRVWNKHEIVFVLKTMSFAGMFLAVVLFVCNPDLLQMENASELIFFGVEKNRNTLAFSLVPSTICSAIMVFYDRKKWRSLSLIYYLAAIVICAVVIIASGARSASISMLLGLFLVAWDSTRMGCSKNERIGKKVLVVILALVALVLLLQFTSGTGSSRLFEDLDDKNGREDLWEFAWELIDEKPVFGGGFDYWNNMNGSKLGTHNTYLTIMVVSGYVGAAFLTVFLFLVCVELWSGKSLVPLAFVLELLCHTYSESGLDYYAYFPLIIAYMLFSYKKFQKRKISTLFID